MAGLTGGAAAAVLANVTRVGVLDTGVAIVSGTIQDQEDRKKKHPRQRGSTVCWHVVDIDSSLSSSSSSGLSGSPLVAFCFGRATVIFISVSRHIFPRKATLLTEKKIISPQKIIPIPSHSIWSQARRSTDFCFISWDHTHLSVQAKSVT